MSLSIPKRPEKYNIIFVTKGRVTHPEVNVEATGGQGVGEATSPYNQHQKPNGNP
jgi:hypothetical protein